MAFRLGGISTVRGFDYGTLVGQAFWSAQLDFTPLPSRIRPVLFVDAGQAGRASGLFDTKALVGAGVGVSLLRGALRFDLSRRLSPDIARLRFDVVIGAVR
jgi:hemolysin activation/secretion protein